MPKGECTSHTKIWVSLYGPLLSLANNFLDLFPNL